MKNFEMIFGITLTIALVLGMLYVAYPTYAAASTYGSNYMDADGDEICDNHMDNFPSGNYTYGGMHRYRYRDGNFTMDSCPQRSMNQHGHMNGSMMNGGGSS